MNVNLKNKKIKDNILYLILFSIVPIFIVQIMGVILMITFNKYNGDIFATITTYISMFGGLCLAPYYYFKKIYNVNLEELGIKKLIYKEKVMILAIIFLLYIYLFIKVEAPYLILVVTMQTIGVAISEEFWARGIIYYILEKCTNKKWIVLIINSLIFTFITHMNRGFMDNLIFRLPGSICIAFAYMKSSKLIYPIIVHFTYNMIGYFL